MEKVFRFNTKTKICIFAFVAIVLLGVCCHKVANNKGEALSFEDALTFYIIDSIEAYAEDGKILKDITGDTEADKLSVQEVKENEKLYRKTIKEIIGNNSIVSLKFVRNDKKCCTYNFEKILNELELGTHMGTGIGCYDTNGNKIYEYGKTEIEKYSPSNSNIIQYFGNEKNELVKNILDEVEKCTKNNYILKDTEGDVTAPKLTLAELQENRKMYEKAIDEMIDNSDIFVEIYFENNKLIVKYKFESVLNELQLGTHMGAGIALDEEEMHKIVLE